MLFPGLFLLARKNGTELTSVANLPLFCMWDATTAWLDERCVGLCLGSKPTNPWLPKQSLQTEPLHHRAGPSLKIFNVNNSGFRLWAFKETFTLRIYV